MLNMLMPTRSIPWVSVLASLPVVPDDLVGRMHYAIDFMPWPLVIFLTAIAAGGIGIAYVADPDRSRASVVPRVVTCKCERRQATLAFDMESPTADASFKAALTAACHWCQADKHAPNRQSPRRSL